MDNKYCLNHLKQLLKTLSCDISELHKMIPKEIMWNVSSDIANEWDYEYIRFFVQNLVDSKVVSSGVEESFQTICNNFERVSIKGKNFDQAIWTTEGFVQHPFWEKQRKLAKQLLNELDKIQL